MCKEIKEIDITNQSKQPRSAISKKGTMAVSAPESHEEMMVAQWRRRQIVRILYSKSPTAVAGSFAGITVISFVLTDVFPVYQLLIWFLCGLMVVILRLITYRKYRLHMDALPQNVWLWWFRVMTFFSGCLYGALSVFFFSENALYQSLVIFLVAGMASGAVGSYAVDMETYSLFLFPSVVPLMITVVIEGERTHLALGILLGILVLFSMRTVRESNRVMEENFALNQSLRYRATHDSLVGLLNREEFENVFVERAYGKPVTVAVLFIDLDNFKAINDMLGHQAGDKALQKIGEFIRGSVRSGDIAARIGGDEFVILLTSCTVKQAEVVATHILKKLSQYQDSLPSQHPKLSASIGIGYSVDEMVSYQAMLEAADTACYRIKQSGKGAYSSQRVKQPV